ncbi:MULTISPECIES: metallophosphoesterase [unclassified Moritella]|uniref:metallophosphoesterase n=1 Tax=unclassified Moritella TaxID=2637987 RepID=UPI001BA605D3|nr:MULTISPECIES: metallophosphoesterase [unclassified Moritella]QUM85636.1 metallophosphoesterase [Moritella sp. 28]QUM89854.1 metallophosphoesterase [Moritella sp. 36]
MRIHKNIPINHKGRDFFVGDIHGEYNLLLATLAQCQFDFECDRLFSVGDIVDRGPDSIACLELLKKPWFYAVRGNHEEMLFADSNSELARIHRNVGGEWFFQCSRDEQARLKLLIEQYCPIAFTIESEFGKIGVCHANAPLSWLSLQNAGIDDMELLKECVWSTKQYKQVKQGEIFHIQGVNLAIHGHVNCTRVTTNSNQLWIDTLMRTRRLTILSAQQAYMVVA